MIQEEKQLGHNSTSKVAAMALRTDFGRSSLVSFKSNKKKPVSTHCGKTGHTMEKCYQLHGFPLRFKFTKNMNVSVHVASIDQEDHPHFSPRVIHSPRATSEPHIFPSKIKILCQLLLHLSIKYLPIILILL